MTHSSTSKYLIGAIIAAVVVSAPLLLIMSLNQMPNSEIKLTLLYNDGAMIEANGVRIYIDPLYIPSNYSDLPADVILITHSHSDHYSLSDIQDIETDDTLFVCPAIMTEAIERHNGLGVNPGDSFLVGDINVTAFHLYMPDYPHELPSSHPKEANWTSYIIEIDGFKIFHAGDAKYMAELEELTGTIDVAFLPIYFDGGYGALNESLLPTVGATDILQPRYVIPMHYVDPNLEIFMSEYSILIENTDCEILALPYFTSFTFLKIQNGYSLELSI